MRPAGFEDLLRPLAPKLLDYPHAEEGCFVDHGARDVDEAYGALVAALDRTFPGPALRRDTRVVDLYFSRPSARPDLGIQATRLRVSLAGMEGEFPPDTAWLIFNLNPEPTDGPGDERIVVAEFAGALASRGAEGLTGNAITRHLRTTLAIHPLFSVEKRRVRVFLSPPLARDGVLGGDLISACVDRILRVAAVSAPAEDLCRYGVLPSRLVCELERTRETDAVRYQQARRSLLAEVETVGTLRPKHERKSATIVRWLRTLAVTHAGR